ncbi:MAG: trypsin-like serine protease [Polyangiaceae bacterium]
MTPRAPHLRLTFTLALTLVLSLTAEDASAIITRDDVDDSHYVVADDDYPALVDLFEPGDCIGTLIHPSYLLTVAHCAVDLTSTTTLTIAGVEHPVAEVQLHPEWRDGDSFDIALIRLAEPVPAITPLRIYRGSEELGAIVTLLGRGVTATGLTGEPGAESDGKLRRATNVVTAANDHVLQFVFEPAEAGTDLEGVGAAGDSGCPVLLDVNGEPQVAGLNAFGDADPGVAIGQYASRDYQTRVSRFAGWLDEHVDLTPTPNPTTREAAGCAVSARPPSSSAWLAALLLACVFTLRRLHAPPRNPLG